MHFEYKISKFLTIWVKFFVKKIIKKITGALRFFRKKISVFHKKNPLRGKILPKKIYNLTFFMKIFLKNNTDYIVPQNMK